MLTLKEQRTYRENVSEQFFFWKPNDNMVEDIGQFGLEYQKSCIHIHSVAILDEKNRNCGYGQMMVKEAIKAARKLSADKAITLDVYYNNDIAIHVYQKCGFEITGRWYNGAYAPLIMTYVGESV